MDPTWEQQSAEYAAHRAALTTVAGAHQLSVRTPHEASCSCGWTGPETNFTAHLEETARNITHHAAPQ